MTSEVGQPHKVQARLPGLTYNQAVFSLVKICVGPGVLALPYAYEAGGFVFSTVSLGLIALWNWASIQWLLKCQQQLHQQSSGSAYAAIGRGAMGVCGVWLVDGCLALTLLGICTVYLVTANDLLSGTVFSFKSLIGDRSAAVTACNVAVLTLLLLPLGCAKDVSFLAGASLSGLAAIAAAFVMILVCGAWQAHLHPPVDLDVTAWEDNVPADIHGFSAFFGIAAFSMGIPMVAFNVQETMQHPEQLSEAVTTALTIVWAAYALVGNVITALYWGSPMGITPNIMDSLSGVMGPGPWSQCTMTALRLLVALCAVLTYPLALVPVGEMLEDWWASGAGERLPLLDPAEHEFGQQSYRECVYNGIRANAAKAMTPNSPQSCRHRGQRVGRVIRAMLMALTAIAAAVVPDLGEVISVVGCFSITAACFILPPVFYMLNCRRFMNHHAMFLAICGMAGGVFTCLMTTTSTLLTIGSQKHHT